MYRSAIVLVVALGACGKHHDASRCGEAFAHLREVGVFPPEGMKLDALSIGMACKDLTDQDLACVAGAKNRDAISRCQHAGNALLAVVVNVQHLGTQGGSAAAAPAELADAVCGCADEACLVQLGESRGDELRKAGPGKDTDRLRACVEPASSKPPAAAPVKQP
jgi:hypothetical protein